MSADPQSILAKSPMGVPQVAAVVLCVCLNALDGFDVLAISFAAPGIADDWGIDRAALGVVLSIEVIGMSVGSIFLGQVADRIGRRPTMLACLVLMSAGMAMAAISGGIAMLSVSRLVAGVGIGGMIASVTAMVAEYTNDKRRSLSIGIVSTGYSIGAIVGGTIASLLLAHFDWRSVFVFGAIATALFLPVTWVLLPESIAFLAKKRPEGALEKINKTLARMGHPTADVLPAIVESRSGFTQLFSPKIVRATVLLTLAYFAHMMTFYFILKWIPKLVVDMGFTASLAGGVAVSAHVGGLTGSFVISFLSQRIDVRLLVPPALLMACIMVAAFGFTDPNLSMLSLVAATAGFFTHSAIVGLYAIFAQTFPTELRAGGTGFVIGVGRAGAVLGPIITGVLLSSGVSLPAVSSTMAAGALLAAMCIFTLRRVR